MPPDITNAELQLAVSVMKMGFTVVGALLSLLITCVVALFLRLERRAEATATQVAINTNMLGRHDEKLHNLDGELDRVRERIHDDLAPKVQTAYQHAQAQHR